MAQLTAGPPPALAATSRPRGLTQGLWRGAQGYLWISPWLIGFLVFTAAPFFISLYLSFTDYRIVGDIRWVGLENYQQLFTEDDVFRRSLGNTFYYLVFHVPGVMLLAFSAALLLNQDVKGRPIFRTLFYLPSVTPGVAATILWVWILSANGLLNSLLLALGVPREASPLWFASTKWSMPGLIIMSLWGIGGTMLIYLAALQGIPKHLYEAAEVDGAGAWKRVRHVTIPMMTPAIFFTLVLGIIGSWQVFTSALVATRGGPADSTMFVLLWLYYQAWEYFRMGYASAIAWILFIVIMVFTLVQFSLARRWVYYEGQVR